ncbi:hypothetical protein O181_023845 [Austropuccinia psidii MF-1]|uniref:Uncharacterized protein n=1 Tax=Austropuccinia psidii MF-1 TaxID=1389203 RepID=A0A9Q3CJD0_9BASI|nr:hypothetical protein [Austropuccinia psidii MF-1]
MRTQPTDHSCHPIKRKQEAKLNLCQAGHFECIAKGRRHQSPLVYRLDPPSPADTSPRLCFPHARYNGLPSGSMCLPPDTLSTFLACIVSTAAAQGIGVQIFPAPGPCPVSPTAFCRG